MSSVELEPEFGADVESYIISIAHFELPPPHHNYHLFRHYCEMATAQVSLPLPTLPDGWSGEKDVKVIGHLSPATKRNIEPVGRHFLAHARRVSRFHAFAFVHYQDSGR